MNLLKIFKQKWWKLGGVALLIFGLGAGLFVPLSSGISDISIDKVKAGETVPLTVYGYNSHYKEGEGSIQSILVYKEGETKISFCLSSAAAKSDQELELTFDIPANLDLGADRRSFDLILFNEVDGTSFLTNALVVESPNGTVATTECATEIAFSKPPGFVFPYREILYETIRNLFFHVPLWFAMILLLFFAQICSIAFLVKSNLINDVYASKATTVALFFGVLGLLTGMVWAKSAWGQAWVWEDPHLQGVAIGMLIYCAYFVLRGSLRDENQRAKVSAVYSIFAFVLFIYFVMIMPKMSEGLHPGKGGNPAFAKYDLDNQMRIVFYSAIIGFTALGFWFTSILIRLHLIKEKQEFKAIDDV